MMRLSTQIKHFYQEQGITVYRAIQDDGMIRLTVPINTPDITGQIRRSHAYAMFGPPLKTKDWIWIRCIPVRADHPGVLIKTGHPRMGCLDGDA
jgi:hypothetical protein